MVFRKYIMTLILVLTAFVASANYTVHSVEGNVTVVKGSVESPVTKGMKLSANDDLIISEGAKIEIHNAMTKEIYASSKAGRASVMSVMMSARSSAGKTASAINKQVRFNPSPATNARQYTEGAIKRSMMAYDPEGGSLSVDPRQMAVNVLSALPATTATSELPVPCAQSPLGESGLQFRIENTVGFPIYFNVLKVAGTAPTEISLSELGQPTGCYVLLPGQALSREHPDGLDSNDRHFIVVAHCKFDVDDLISATGESNIRQELKVDQTLPVYLRVL